MEALFERQNRLLALTSEAFVRQMMKDINWDARLIAIRGARGVGKTTLMLQYIKSHYSAGSRSALYCSLDSLYFTEHRLVDLAELFYKAGGKHLFLDEVHKYPSWSREVKEIYDIYPDLRIVVSGSSLLNIIHGDADLSRRCVAYSMQGLSFREFLAFFHNINIPVHPLEDVLEHATGLCAQVNAVCRPLPLFKDYLQHGYYPYYKENQHDYFTTIEQVASFVIESELPQLCGVEASNTRKIKALLGIIATSVPFEVDISKLSTVIGVHRNTTLEYLGDLGKAGLLTLLYADLLSVKKMQKPDKIYLENPNMLYALATRPVKIGTARETFAVNQLRYGHTVEYGKQSGDFKVDGQLVFEVGGADKSYNQIADLPHSYILADDIEYPYGNKLPLWTVGMMY